jgi:hypothetical protein
VATAERDLGYQSPEGDLKDVFTGGSLSIDDSETDRQGTPCSLVYGAKACLPSETLMDSPRVQSFDKSV